MNLPAPDYDDLERALADTDATMSAAEAHGMVTGNCCAPDAPPLAQLFFGDAAVPAEGATEHLLAVLTALQVETQRRLGSTDFEFEPLLPASPQDPGQVEALAEWARGFLLGLAASGVRDPRVLPDEAGEFLLDVMQIGEVEADEDATPEQQEREIAEIVEYLRAGVQVVHDELRRGAPH